MFEDIRQSTDMVLVSVSENNGFELLFVFKQITHVGMTRSIPKRSTPGNMRPQSMAIDAPPHSRSIMLRPNSPMPPRGMTFSDSILPQTVRFSMGDLAPPSGSGC